MEKSEQQKRIINLGKLLIAELGLENSVDTLSRWVAHYIAEKIALAESLPPGKENEDIRDECFEKILMLWKHRWSLTPDNQPLKDFRLLLGVLDKLNPENEKPFFFRILGETQAELSDFNPNIQEIRNYTEMALQIDKIAKIWIDTLLHDAASKVKNEKVANLLENAVNLPDSEDIIIIKTVLGDGSESSSERRDNIVDHQKAYHIEKLRKRIDELEKFTELNEFMLDFYKKELRLAQFNS